MDSYAEISYITDSSVGMNILVNAYYWDSCRIKEKVLSPLAIKDTSGLTDRFFGEIYWYDKNLMNEDENIHRIYSNGNGVYLLRVVNNKDKLFLALHHQLNNDTIYLDHEAFSFPRHSQRASHQIVKYDLNRKIFEILKNIYTWTAPRVRMSVDDKYLYIAMAYSYDAIVDSIVIETLGGGIHEQDILILKIDRTTNQIIQLGTFKGRYFDYIHDIQTDAEENIYLCMDFYSRYIHYGDDTLEFYNPNGTAVFAKINKDEELEWHRRSNAFILKSLVGSDNNLYIMGYFLKSLYLDTTLLFEGAEVYHPYIMKFDKQGNYLSHRVYEGDGERLIYHFKKDGDDGFIIAGTFKGRIEDGNGSYVDSEGAEDAFVYFTDLNGTVRHAYYFQGDSTDRIEDVSRIDKGHYWVTGFTRSSRVTSGTDLLIPDNDDTKWYYTYSIPDSVIRTKVSEPKSNGEELEIHITFDRTKRLLHVQNVEYQAVLLVTDVQGNQLLNRDLEKGTTKIHLDDWPQGIYLYRLTDIDSGANQSGRILLLR